MSLRYIHGIETDTEAVQKLNDPTFQFQRTTHGEMRLALLGRQLDILLAAHPSVRAAKEWEKGKTMIENALYAGVHGLPSTFTGLFSSETQKVAREIKKAQKNFGVPGGFEFVNRNSLLSGISDDILTQRDCGVIYDGMGYKPGVKYVTAQQYMNCSTYVPILNTWLEKSAHNLIYEFQKDISETVLVALKGLAHQQAITEAANITGFQRSNIRLWVENGIMRYNADKGLGAIGGVASIGLIRQGKDDKIKFDINGVYNSEGQVIGFLDPATLTLIITIGKIVVAAIAAVAGLISAIKGHNATAFATQSLKLLGGAEGAASPTDFQINTSTGTGTGTGNGTGTGTGDDTDTGTNSEPFDLQSYIKENPLQAGAIGLGAGFVAGKVLKVW